MCIFGKVNTNNMQTLSTHQFLECFLKVHISINKIRKSFCLFPPLTKVAFEHFRLEKLQIISNRHSISAPICIFIYHIGDETESNLWPKKYGV